ncbi:MAG: PDZ domain-containing protein [Calditrichaeota bacterium]|nr:MAG: PDZ domain-containing protein [Calditrichota bacterium]
MLKRTLLILAVLTFGLLIANSSFAQGHRKTMTFEGEAGKITIIQGIGAILKEVDGELIVEMMLPKENLPKDLRNVDLKKDDIVFMCNGKKVKTVDEFNAIVEALENGDEIKLGVKRGKDRLITALPKSEGEGQMMMMTTTVDDGGGEESSVNLGGKMMKDVTFLSCGIVLQDKDGQVEVIALTPQFKTEDDGQKPDGGDILIAVNDTKAETAQALRAIYNKAADNDKVKLTFSKDGTEYSTFVIKKKDDGEVMIKKN